MGTYRSSIRENWHRLTTYVEHIVEDRINALLTKDPNKLKVYVGYKQYQLEINGVIHLISEDTVISYEGQQLTGQQLYEKLTKFGESKC